MKVCVILSVLFSVLDCSLISLKPSAFKMFIGSLIDNLNGILPFYDLCRPIGFASALNTMTTNTFNVSEAEKKRILEEESQHLEKLKVRTKISMTGHQ